MFIDIRFLNLSVQYYTPIIYS